MMKKEKVIHIFMFSRNVSLFLLLRKRIKGSLNLFYMRMLCMITITIERKEFIDSISILLVLFGSFYILFSVVF